MKDDDIWKHIIDSYFSKTNGNVLIKHQIDSFNHFIETTLPNILKETQNIFFIKRIGNKITDEDELTFKMNLEIIES